MFTLIKKQKFWPFFLTLFLGAFNDNLFRTSLVTFVIYGTLDYSVTTKSIIVTAAIGLFMLPYFLFSPLAGQLADKFPKAILIRWIKGAEVIIACFVAYGFLSASPLFLLGVLFIMGAQSAFFGPIKYSILPDILQNNEIIEGNGWVEAGTFLAILLGTLCGAIIISSAQYTAHIISISIFSIAVLGFLASLMIPIFASPSPRLTIGWSYLSQLEKIIEQARRNPIVFRSILGISWFWLVGAVFLSQLPSWAKVVLNLDQGAFALLLTTFTLGIGCGSLFCNLLLKGEITAKYIPWMSLGIMFFIFDISTFSTNLVAMQTAGTIEVLTSFQGLHLTFDIFAIALFGGFYIVPLMALLQTKSLPSRRSQNIAANNIFNSMFMVAATVLCAGFLYIGASVSFLFILTGIGQLIVTMVLMSLMPDHTIRTLLYTLCKAFFRLKVHGLENLPKKMKHIVMIANHDSYLDPLIIAASLPIKPIFAINVFIAQKWWVKPFLLFATVFPIDPTKPHAIRDLINEARRGVPIFIFPEGQITSTGSLMKVYEGTALVAHKAHCQIVPIRLNGTQYTFLSYLKGIFPRRLFPKITVSILPPTTLAVPQSIHGQDLRRNLGNQLYQTMKQMMFASSHISETLTQSLITISKRFGRSYKILEDIKFHPLSYGRLIMRAYTLGRHIAREHPQEKMFGLMLPNTLAIIINFWALHFFERVPAILNYTSGPKNILNSCQAIPLKTVFTSKLFITKLKLEKVIEKLQQQKIKIVYLEEMQKKLNLSDKLMGICSYFIYKPFLAKAALKTNPNDPAVILFTSGSEGTPKGVVLSHQNLQANRYQVSVCLDFTPHDKVFNALPLFHSFGFMGGVILPLLTGVKSFHYPSPLHYRTVPEFIYNVQATILFSTDTFLRGYGKSAHPYDFNSLRYVFAGAEKLKQETQDLWFEKFGIRIFEGYGVTETSPVLSVNTMMEYKEGTVGKLLPAISSRITPIKDIKQGGQLLVKGSNVMLGYFKTKHPGQLIPPPQGWYDTGDIVEQDKEGYITIQGRTKRFAKVAGEMISLSAIEDIIAATWPDYHHAIITRPDQKKGEVLILYTDCSKITRQTLLKAIREKGHNELYLPKEIFYLKEIPLLGNGKINYQQILSDTSSKK